MSKHLKDIYNLVTQDINATDSMGNTPLFLAAWNGHEKVATALISSGADVNVANKFGQTPLHIAASCKHEKIALMLINAGADVNMAGRSRFVSFSAIRSFANACWVASNVSRAIRFRRM